MECYECAYRHFWTKRVLTLQNYFEGVPKRADVCILAQARSPRAARATSRTHGPIHVAPCGPPLRNPLCVLCPRVCWTPGTVLY